jgi:hypothetical protein
MWFKYIFSPKTDIKTKKSEIIIINNITDLVNKLK